MKTDIKQDKNFLKMHAKYKVSKEDIERVYIQDNLGTRLAAKKLGIGRPTMSKYIDFYDIPRKKRGIYQKYYAKNNFFSQWSSDMAYCLGFIAADGHVWKDRCFVTIGIHQRDITILEKIRDCISPTSPVRKTGDKCQLCFKSVQIHKDLNKLGVSHNKTFQLRLPKVPKKYFGDFIRGFFDGDGGIWKIKRKTRDPYIASGITCASKQFLLDLQRRLGFGALSKCRQYYRIDFSETACIKLRDLMYKNNPTLKLNRKFDIFFEIKEKKCIAKLKKLKKSV